MKQILKGYFFMLLYKAGLITDARMLSKVGQRMLTCNGCPLREGKWCTKCGCYLPAKVWSNSMCPENKWEE